MHEVRTGWAMVLGNFFPAYNGGLWSIDKKIMNNKK